MFSWIPFQQEHSIRVTQRLQRALAARCRLPHLLLLYLGPRLVVLLLIRSAVPALPSLLLHKSPLLHPHRIKTRKASSRSVLCLLFGAGNMLLPTRLLTIFMPHGGIFHSRILRVCGGCSRLLVGNACFCSCRKAPNRGGSDIVAGYNRLHCMCLCRSRWAPDGSATLLCVRARTIFRSVDVGQCSG